MTTPEPGIETLVLPTSGLEGVPPHPGAEESAATPNPAGLPATGLPATGLPATGLPAGLPATDAIARLANAFFHALPDVPVTEAVAPGVIGLVAPGVITPPSTRPTSADAYAPAGTPLPGTSTGPAPGSTESRPAPGSLTTPRSVSPATPSVPSTTTGGDGAFGGMLDALDLGLVPTTFSPAVVFARPTTRDAPAESPAPSSSQVPSTTPPRYPTSHSYFATDAVSAASSTQTPFRFDTLTLPQESVTYSPSRIPTLPPEPRPFDPYTIRRDFPILQEQVHGKRLIWLDNGATTQKPRSVIDRLTRFYEHENSNVHRGAHALAARATDAFEGARDKVRRFLNAASAREIIFVRGTTEGINLVSQSWGRQNIGAGDEILVTHLEHHANIVPWQQLVAQTGARLRVAPVDDSGQVILEEYERLLNSRTKLVAITAVSNALGTITPAQMMVAAAHRHGALALIDGAQAVSHMPVDVQSLDADFYVFSGHKVFAPTGIGVVYGKQAVLEATQPWQGGGNMIKDVTFERTVFQDPPGRFEAGTGNIADAVGLGTAIDYVSAIGMPVIAAYEHGLLEYATDGLHTVPGLRMIGTAIEKAGVLSFVIQGIDPVAIGQALDREGIAVRAGHHCAQPILRRFGVEGTVRASLAPYNTCEDIDALVSALQVIAARR